MLRISLFAGTRLRVDGGDAVGLGHLGTKPRQLFEILALHAGQVTSKEVPADLLGEGTPPSSSGAGLESYVSVLRHRLGLGIGRTSVLATADNGYALDTSCCEPTTTPSCAWGSTWPSGRPDLAVLDVTMSDGDSIEAIRRKRDLLPGTRVVVLTWLAAAKAAARDAGASAFLLKDVPPAVLLGYPGRRAGLLLTGPPRPEGAGYGRFPDRPGRSLAAARRTGRGGEGGWSRLSESNR